MNNFSKRTVFLFLLLSCFVSIGPLAVAEETLGIKTDRFERLSVPVYLDQIVLVEQNRSHALFQFTKFGRDATAQYRYKLLAHGSQQIEEGEGTLYEWRREKDKLSQKKRIVNPDEQLMLIAGSVQIEWSHASEKKGYIYYFPRTTRVMLFHSSYYQKMKVLPVRGKLDQEIFSPTERIYRTEPLEQKRE